MAREAYPMALWVAVGRGYVPVDFRCPDRLCNAGVTGLNQQSEVGREQHIGRAQAPLRGNPLDQTILGVEDVDVGVGFGCECSYQWRNADRLVIGINRDVAVCQNAG
ncbi:MAG: hypothetical protein ACREC6_10985 [Hyphomicrobiaceae bacterium]